MTPEAEENDDEPCEPGDGLTPHTSDRADSRLWGWMSLSDPESSELPASFRKLDSDLSAAGLVAAVWEDLATPQGDSWIRKRPELGF